MSIIQISSNEINQVLSKFNFLFNLKYKNELDISLNYTSASAPSFYKTNSSINDNNIEYILGKGKEITIDSNSDYYYSSFSNHNRNKEQSILEKITKIKVFNNDFLIFYQNITSKRYIIRTKKEFTEIMLKIPICQSILFLKFLKIFWVVLNIVNFTSDQKASEMLERFDLSFSNIAKKNNNINDFELHKAVYESNLRMISKILSNNNTKNSFIYCDINEVDPNNNTPLLLALKLNNADVVRVLCDHEAEIQNKSFDGAISPLEYAFKKKMTKMLKILVNAKKNKKFNDWVKNKNFVFDLIKNIPNFTMNLKLNFDSNLLNLFSSLTASDCYKISKLDGDMRIDMNVNSNNEFKGKNSILIKYKDKKIYKIDHIKQVSYDYIEQISSDRDEEKKVNKLLKEGIINMKVYMDTLDLINTKSTKNILGYQCNVYKVKGAMFVEKEVMKEVPENIESSNCNYKNNILKKSFEEYYYENIKTKKLKKNAKKQSTKSVTLKKNEIPEENEITDDERFQTDANINSKRKNQIKVNKKQLDMTVWLSKEFPLTLQHFLPLIHILSFASGDFSQLEHTISQKFLPFQSFPLKISFPLGMSFHALLSIVDFSLENPNQSEFDLNYIIKDPKFDNPQINEINYCTDTDNNFYQNYYKEKGVKSNSDSYNNDSDDYTQQIREFQNVPSKNMEEENISDRYCNTLTSVQSSKVKKVNNEIESSPFQVPIAPLRRRKRQNNELERQNTIKCMIQLKLPKELIDKYHKNINKTQRKISKKLFFTERQQSPKKIEKNEYKDSKSNGCDIF